MTIDTLVTLAQTIHDAERWDLGGSSSRETRNAFWARVIGCAHHGHPAYNLFPDKQWHLKRADANRPQTDDVATSMPSRQHWDCIPGAGANGYRFEAHYAGVLPAGQIVYAPPVPDGSGSLPVPVPVPTPPVFTVPDYEAVGGDAFGRAMIGVPLAADFATAGQPMNDGAVVWSWRTCHSLLSALVKANGQPIDPAAIVKKHRNEWRRILGLPPV